MNVDRNRSTLLPGLQQLGRLPGQGGIRSVRVVVGLLILMLALAANAGCVPVPRGDDSLDIRFMTPDELRDYSERVFRRQNSLTTRLMLAPPMGDALSAAERGRIVEAESRMNEACASLNEIAGARASGRDVDIELENTVRKTVRPCAAATRRLERILNRLGIGSTSFEPGGMDPTP